MLQGWVIIITINAESLPSILGMGILNPYCMFWEVVEPKVDARFVITQYCSISSSVSKLLGRVSLVTVRESHFV